MLPKKYRANTKDVELIFQKGIFLGSPNLTFKYFRSQPNERIKISFIAPKNIAKMAVQRNLLRRRGYIALGKYINQFPLGITGVFVFKKYQDDISIIENEIKNILNKIN